MRFSRVKKEQRIENYLEISLDLLRNCWTKRKEYNYVQMFTKVYPDKIGSGNKNACNF